MPKAHPMQPSRTETVAGALRGAPAEPYSMYATTSAGAHDLKQPLRDGFRQAEHVGGFTRNNESNFGHPDAPSPTQRANAKRGPKYNGQLDNPAHSPHTTISRASFIPPVAHEQDDPEMAAAIALHRQKRQATGFTSNSNPVQATDTTDYGSRAQVEHVRQRIGNKDPIARENDWAGPGAMSTTSSAAYGAVSASREPTDWRAVEARRVQRNGGARNTAPSEIFPQQAAEPITSESRAAFVDHSFLPEGELPQRSARPRPALATNGVLPLHGANPLPEAYSRPLNDHAEEQLRRKNPIEHDLYRNPEPYQTTSRRAFAGEARDSARPSDVLDANPAARAAVAGERDVGRALKKMTGRGRAAQAPASGYGKNIIPPPAHRDNEPSNSVYQASFLAPYNAPIAAGPAKTGTGFVNGVLDHGAFY